MSCACGDIWRIESCDLETGIIRGVLHPLSADFQTSLNEPGQGTLTLATGRVNIRDIWPHMSSIYISRIAGGNASPDNPICEFAGIVQQINPQDNNTTRVGLQGIENYLNHRMLRTDFIVREVDQNEIGRRLVARAQLNGIPLSAVAHPSEISGRDRTYNSWDREVIGEKISQLTEVINGPDWFTEHIREAGRWRSVIHFVDRVGVRRTVELGRFVTGFGIEVDAQNQATLVDAMGAGSEDQRLIATAIDNDGPYVRFEETQAHSTVKRMETLQEHADGFIEENREPAAMPSVEIAGLEPDPEDIQLGDTIDLNICFGAATYVGPARVIGRSWRIEADAPVSRTFEFNPLSRASEAVLGQPPCDDGCEDC